MDPVDTIARISQLLLSRRISANLVVSVLLAAAIVVASYLLRPSIIVEFWALGTTLCTLLLLTLLAFSYGLANLVNGSIIDLGRVFITRRRAAEERRRSDVEAEKKREEQEKSRRQRVGRMCNLIRHFTEEQRILLKVLHDDAPRQEIACNENEFYSLYRHLVTNGFVDVVERDLPERKAIFRLSSEGVEAIRAIRQAASAPRPDAALPMPDPVA